MDVRPLIIGPGERKALADLRALAAAHPVDMPALEKRIETRRGKREHMAAMTRQSVDIPFGYLATFSIEQGHPCGAARHLSVSIAADDALKPLPSQEAVWMIAEELGFVGSLSTTCVVWIEDLRQGKAINVVQPLDVVAEGAA